MIPRYSRKILKEIWEDNNKFQIWLDLEILASEAMEKLGQIPKGTSNRIKKKAKFKVKEIEKIEELEDNVLGKLKELETDVDKLNKKIQ